MKNYVRLLAIVLSALLGAIPAHATVSDEAPMAGSCAYGDLVMNNPNAIATSVSAAAFPLRAPAGSASAPSYSFTLNPNTGMYQNANSLVLGVNGYPALSIDPNFLVTAKAINLTGVTGELQFQGNTVYESDGASTYLSPSNDTTGSLNIYTGGSSRIQVTNAGKTQFFTAGSAASPTVTLGGGAGLGFHAPTNTSLAIDTNSTIAATVDANQNWTFNANVTIAGNSNTSGSATIAGTEVVTGTATDGNVVINPNTGFVGWTGITNLFSHGDGKLRIAKNANGNPTTLASGLYLGPATSSGVSWVYDSSVAGWRAQNGDNSANAGVAANSFRITNADGSIQFGTTTYGMAIGATSTNLVANSVTGLMLNSTGNATALKPAITAKTSNYTVVAADSYTTFTNTGAGGTVTFTLPTPAAGLQFTFIATAAQTITVTTPSGSVFGFTISYGVAGAQTQLTGASRSCAVQGGVFSIVSDGTNYYVVSQNGPSILT